MADFPITVSTRGVESVPNLSSASARKCASLLQKNHENYHIFWNFKGFHNHHVHYMLTAWALGADTKQLQESFDSNVGYQRPKLPDDENLVAKLDENRHFESYLGNEAYFPVYTEFFKKKIAEDGLPKVVNNYLLSKSAIAEDMMAGLFAGVVHPLIHFGFGIEFEQPAVVAEAMAQAAVHPKSFKTFFHRAEELAQKSPPKYGAALIDLFREIRADPKLYDEEHWDGGDSLNDHILSDAPEKLCEIASRWTVDVDEIDAKTAELMNVEAFVAGAAQRRDKQIKLDFFLIHAVNANIFFSAFNAQTWMSAQDKARMLEWKGRSGLIQYASRIAPTLLGDEINNYTPKQSGMTWSLLIERTNKLTYDDGHIAKFVRSVAHGEKICAPYYGPADRDKKLPLSKKGWFQLANMAVDNTTEGHVLDRWLRGAGRDKAWDKVAAR